MITNVPYGADTLSGEAVRSSHPPYPMTTSATPRTLPSRARRASTITGCLCRRWQAYKDRGQRRVTAGRACRTPGDAAALCRAAAARPGDQAAGHAQWMFTRACVCTKTSSARLSCRHSQLVPRTQAMSSAGKPGSGATLPWNPRHFHYYYYMTRANKL
ncbi:hypothetical protein LSAT2_002341 [Lamellibrachia satsuma]|nr:hypothetical protein LSAT2_002341 [Lamellibrachia satsuma]